MRIGEDRMCNVSALKLLLKLYHNRWCSLLVRKILRKQICTQVYFTFCSGRFDSTAIYVCSLIYSTKIILQYIIIHSQQTAHSRRLFLCFCPLTIWLVNVVCWQYGYTRRSMTSAPPWTCAMLVDKFLKRSLFARVLSYNTCRINQTDSFTDKHMNT